MQMTWTSLIFITILGFFAWLKTSSILIGVLVFVLQFITAPFVTTIIIRYLAKETFHLYPNFWVVMSNIMTGGIIFNIIFFGFLK